MKWVVTHGAQNRDIKYGYNYVCMNQGVSNELLFMSEFKQPLQDCYPRECTKSAN